MPTDMSNTRGKHEVNSARHRLNATLQDLMEKKDDSFSSSGEVDITSLTVEDFIGRPSSPLSSPGKRGPYSKPSSSRKRKRRDDDIAGGDSTFVPPAYVMKLFDRTVDLAQFSENATLYPICRAWLQNEPHGSRYRSRCRSPTPEPELDIPGPYMSGDEESAGKMPDIYSLPEPIKLEDRSINLRIPSPVPCHDEPLNIHADDDSAPVPEQLLLDHMARWKIIRQKWRDAGQRNEAAYAPSLNLLKEMYDRQCKDG